MNVKRMTIFMGIFSGSMWLLGFITGHTVGCRNHNWLNGYSKGYSKGVEDELEKLAAACGCNKKEDK